MEKVTQYKSIEDLKAATSRFLKKGAKNDTENNSLRDFIFLLKKNVVSKTTAIKADK